MKTGIQPFQIWGNIPDSLLRGNVDFYVLIKFDGFVKSLLERHPGESRGPEHPEITGFRLSPE
jgi:hypothetical protein